MDKQDGLATSCRTFIYTLPIPLATATARTSPTLSLIALGNQLMSTEWCFISLISCLIFVLG
jgi:hypothetical protein